MLQRINILSKYRHKKGICGTVLTVQYLLSGKHKNYDHVLTSNFTNTRHISGEWFSCNYSYIICFQVEIKHGNSRKISDPLPILQITFNPKRAGLFCLSQDRGGGFRPPPQISAAEQRKILKFGTHVELVNTNVLTKFQYWKSKRFLIMQIYVNYMHIFLFLIITDKMRPFGAFKLFWCCHRNI